jgi:hypothetical protein
MNAKLPQSEKQNRRKRLAEVHRGIHAVLDRAVEERGGNTEEPAREYELRRADVQDLFALRTRRKLREIESELRDLRAELRSAA